MTVGWTSLTAIGVLTMWMSTTAAAASPAGARSKAATVEKEAQGTVRIFVGGDARDDVRQVTPWALEEAKRRGASAFIFLGDMELTPEFDWRFKRKVEDASPLQFFPLLGNHEVKELGVASLPSRHERQEREARFQSLFLHTGQTPVESASPDKTQVYYGVDLAGDLHYVALDNVSQKGFGTEQLDWLQRDLDAAQAAGKVIIVGMHQPLAKNPCTQHSMEADGPRAIAESDVALDIFKRHGVARIFASHTHEYDCFRQGGILTYVTGGMGAPLTRKGADRSFHHVLQVDVARHQLTVEVVKFEGSSNIRKDKDDEKDEDDEAKKEGRETCGVCPE